MTRPQIVLIRIKYDLKEEASYHTLAREYGVNPSTIRNVIQYLGAYQ